MNLSAVDDVISGKEVASEASLKKRSMHHLFLN